MSTIYRLDGRIYSYSNQNHEINERMTAHPVVGALNLSLHYQLDQSNYLNNIGKKLLVLHLLLLLLRLPLLLLLLLLIIIIIILILF